MIYFKIYELSDLSKAISNGEGQMSNFGNIVFGGAHSHNPFSHVQSQFCGPIRVKFFKQFNKAMDSKFESRGLGKKQFETMQYMNNCILKCENLNLAPFALEIA